MAEGKRIIGWFTANGKHIPIVDGKIQSDAINRAIIDKNEKIKQEQIAKNKAQVEQLNRVNLPRRLSLDDIPAEVANMTTNVLNLGTKQRFRFQDGTKITEVVVFAGKGCSKEFRNAKKYADRWGGKAEDWQHCSGKAQITNGKKIYTREVHWVQGKDGKMREAFIKYYDKKKGEKQ